MSADIHEIRPEPAALHRPPGPAEPAPFLAPARDGYTIRGFVWRHPEEDPGRPVVLITAATSVRCRYYARFAAALAARGCDVVTYDYRGIGESRPARMRGFPADWIDWGRLDFDAALRQVLKDFPGRPVDVVAHSIGGFALGLSPLSPALRRIVTVGAQFAYWRDYDPALRAGMVAKWHVAMPLITALAGYFPGKRLGWLEDTPAGVVRDWSTRRARFEDTLKPRHGPPETLVAGFSAVTAPILAVSLADDPYGTVAAVERLLAYYSGSARTHVRLAPDAGGTDGIGHFAFFHARYAETLWPLAFHFLDTGEVAPRFRASILRRMPAGAP